MNTQNVGSKKAKELLTYELSAPLSDAATAIVDINAGTGNLTIDALSNGEQLLVAGVLEYLEKQGPPSHVVDMNNGQATLTVSGKGGIEKPRFRFPWSACNGATDWNIHVNPGIQAKIGAKSGGGNVKLNLAGMIVTGVAADSGGGNMEVVLPVHATDLCATVRTGGGNVVVEIGNETTGMNAVTATSGAGNVEVRVPEGIAALIHARSGLGKIIVAPQFNQVDGNTFQSPDYSTAADKVEITAHSGAGNVSIVTK